MTEEEIEKMLNEFTPNKHTNEFVKKNNEMYIDSLKRENKVANNFTDWLGVLSDTGEEVLPNPYTERTHRMYALAAEAISENMHELIFTEFI
jgi:hypothetical protein